MFRISQEHDVPRTQSAPVARAAPALAGVAISDTPRAGPPPIGGLCRPLSAPRRATRTKQSQAPVKHQSSISQVLLKHRSSRSEAPVKHKKSIS